MITERVTLNIENARREYTILHISDVHIALAAENDDENEIKYAEKSTALWTRDGIIPAERFERFISFAAEAKPDAVIVSGDAIEICRRQNIDYLKKSFGQLPCPVMFICGNHESFGLNGEPHGPYYADMMKGSPDLWCEDLGDFLVVGVDNCRKQITREQLDALKGILARGTPTVLVMHVPPITNSLRDKIANFWGEDDVDYFEFCGEGTEGVVGEFGELIKTDPAVIAVLAGHVHFAHNGELSEGKKLLVAAPLFEGFVREINIK